MLYLIYKIKEDKEMNKRGFTLIELLAVIVILGVLLAIAVPSVSKYISVSKKSTYIDNAQVYASTAREQAMLGTFKFPVNQNEATVVYFSALTEHLDKGGKISPYGAAYKPENSFIVIANIGTAEEPSYKYYIAAVDAEGYGIGKFVNDTATSLAIAYDDLTTDKIIQGGQGIAPNGSEIEVEGGKYTITKTYNVDES